MLGAKSRFIREKKIMVLSVKSFGDVKKHNPDELSSVQSLVPVIQAVKKKHLGRMLGPKSRLIREEKVVLYEDYKLLAQIDDFNWLCIYCKPGKSQPCQLHSICSVSSLIHLVIC